jgi:geranylgeranyl reductase family protein
MTRWDVIVAGAGPAGSTAARECAALGLSTVIIDKAEFPRDKPCGGGVNVRAARLLPFDLTPVVERSITGMYISVRQGAGFTRYADQTLTYLTQRRFLDTYLLEQAERAGARVDQRTAVRAVERTAASVTVRAGNQVFEGRTLVVADGANGPTAGLAGIEVARRKEIALEGNITPADEALERWSNVFAIDIGSVTGGYGWLFPKGDHVNIGVGGLASIGPSLRSLLGRMTAFYGFDPADLWGIRGHPLPVRLPGAPVFEGNVLLTGDAAGFLDPLSGEGIYAAIWSGQRAAHHLAEYLTGVTPSLDGYRLEVERTLEPDLVIARQLHTLFHISPPLWAAFVRRSSRAWRLLSDLITGSATYSGARQQSRLISLGLHATAAGVRVAGAVHGGNKLLLPATSGWRPGRSH